MWWDKDKVNTIGARSLRELRGYTLFESGEVRCYLVRTICFNRYASSSGRVMEYAAPTHDDDEAKPREDRVVRDDDVFQRYTRRTTSYDATRTYATTTTTTSRQAWSSPKTSLDLTRLRRRRAFPFGEREEAEPIKGKLSLPTTTTSDPPLGVVRRRRPTRR